MEAGCLVCLVVELCESGDLLCQIKLRAPGSLFFGEDVLEECAVQVRGHPRNVYAPTLPLHQPTGLRFRC